MEYLLTTPIQDLVPFCDNITFSMRCHDWKRWRSILEEYSGEKLLPRKASAHIDRGHYLCQRYGIRTTAPNEHSWLVIFLVEPTSRNLLALQDMIKEYHYGDLDTLEKKFCLSRIEITWDFFFNHASEIDCQNIIRRLAYRLVSVQKDKSGKAIPAMYRFTRCITERKFEKWPELVDKDGMPFASYEDCLLKTNKGSEAEGNGDFLIYEQAYRRKDRGKSMFDMQYNPKAHTHTTMYCKRLQDIWVCRFEMRLEQQKLKKCLLFDRLSLPSILDEIRKFRFSDFWVFIDLDYRKFRYDLFSSQKNLFGKNLPRKKRCLGHIKESLNPIDLLQNEDAMRSLIDESRGYPTTDRIRVMREASVYADKSFKHNLIDRYSKIISFDEAINTPVPKYAMPIFQDLHQDEDVRKGMKRIQLHHA